LGVKQTLAIRKFIGTCENAVRTQNFIALIVFLLMHMAHAGQTAVVGPQTFVPLVRHHLRSRDDIADLRTPQRKGIRKSMSPFPDVSVMAAVA
jgi:hypothetical protein